MISKPLMFSSPTKLISEAHLASTNILEKFVPPHVFLTTFCGHTINGKRNRIKFSLNKMFSLKSNATLARSSLIQDRPVYVQFYITARCNLTCQQCNIIYSNSDVRECSIYEIEKIAENFAKMGVAIVLLTGGEPFVRKDLPEIIKAFELIGMAKVSTSAQEAKEYGYLNSTDGITMNRDRLLYDAKLKALELSKNNQ